MKAETRPQSFRPALRGAPALILGFACAGTALLGMPRAAAAQALAPAEEAMVAFIRQDLDHGMDLLEQTVNINSGTLNPEGVRRVAEVMTPEFEALGFDVRWVPLPAETNRAGHLIAERRGDRGQRLLLIGHLDTVFEEDSPFQRFELLDDGREARGPGVIDMKGGNMVIVQALRALDEVGALDGTTIAVVLTGDEESPGRPLDISRRDLIEAAQRSDVALGFEGGSRDEDGPYAVISRRSAEGWTIRTTGQRSHSSVVFREGVGAGAIYEAARILDTFLGELGGEEHLTFSAGLFLGGSDVEYDPAREGGEAFGKTNVVPRHALVRGDLRAISQEQLEGARQRMREIVSRNLPGTTAEIEFAEGYPPMSPTDGNYALLDAFDRVSRDLGYAALRPFDPGGRGAADISFVAPYIDGIDGLGPYGRGSHTEDETIDLASLPEVIERAAVFMYRLTR